MAQSKKIRIGPVALTTTLTTNVFNCAIASVSGGVGITHAQPYVILRHIHILNKTGSAATFSLWIGATGANAAGTEFWNTALSVPANSSVDWYGEVRLDSTDFLVGGSNTATALTLQGEGEIGFSG